MVQLLSEREDHLVLSPLDIISLKDAGIRGGAFAMRELDEENLKGLFLSDPATWPPVKVTLSIRGYILIDGYHRWETVKSRQIDRIIATCESYESENDVIEAAFRANLHHGKPSSAESRSDYAYWLHITYPEMEQQEIAERVGITQSTVSKAISRREEDAKRARQGPDVVKTVDEKERKAQKKKSCKKFTRLAAHFLQEVEDLDDQELAEMLLTVMKKSDPDGNLRAKLGRIFNGIVAPQQSTGPLRLRQFASRS